MGFLHAGEILRVDLTNQRVEKEPTAPYAKQFFGGRGINTKILYDGVGPEVDPLAPDNIIAFGTGPLTGTTCPGSGRTDVMAKSPLTNILGNSNFGGYWAPELKWAGYDHVVVRGKAEKPVYIFVDNEKVEIRDASSVWGKDTYETQAIIRAELGNPEVQIMCIGPAGENLVRYATIMHAIGNAAGRTGMGAVMGSKNLKAIAVRGTKGVKVADPDRFLELSEKAHNLIKQSRWYGHLSSGTEYVSGTENSANHPVGNNQSYAGLRRPKGKTLMDFGERYFYKKVGCFNCPLKCMDLWKVPGLPSTVLSCTNYVACNSPKIVDVRVFYEELAMCQRYGIDSVSFNNILGWFMELYQRGIITEKDADGIAVEWGKREAIIPLLQKTIRREGVGDILADGLVEAAKRIGRGSEKYAIHAKGNPDSGYSLGFIKSFALGHALSLRGDYTRSAGPEEMMLALPLIALIGDEEMLKEAEKYYGDFAERITGIRKAAIPQGYEGKAALNVWTEDVGTSSDMLGNCRWLDASWILDMPFTPEFQAEIFSAGTGVPTTPDMLFETAASVRCLDRSCEVREGKTRKDDAISKIFFQPIPDGVFKGEKLEPDKFEKMKDEYYELRGWDVKTGIPTRETLERYGLKYVASDLKRTEIGRQKIRIDSKNTIKSITLR